jgi:hypothetical protein
VTIHSRAVAVFLVVMVAVPSGGCLLPTINFDPPDFEPIELERVPDSILADFTRKYPKGQIESVGTRDWPPTGDTHYRFLFDNGGRRWYVRFREDGSLLGEGEMPAQEDAEHAGPSGLPSPVTSTE